MLNAVIRFALQYRMPIVLLSLGVLVYGSYIASTLPIDVFPDLDRPRVVVMTEAHGLAPEEVEALVSFPLESALLGATGVEAVRSQSGMGLSVIYVEFGWDTDIWVARQVVRERLASAQDNLPPGIKPQMMPISSIMGQVLQVGMYHRTGPHGGELLGLGKTGKVAELVYHPRTGQVMVHFLDPQPRNDPSIWEPIENVGTPVTLTWRLPRTTFSKAPPISSRSAERSSGPSARSLLRDPRAGRSGARAKRDPQPDPELFRDHTVSLSPVPDQVGVYQGTDEDLALRRLPTSFKNLHLQVDVYLDDSHQKGTLLPYQQRLMHLRTLADWVVRPGLLKIAGIAQITVMGGGRKQYQVLVNPPALLQHGVSLHQVEEAVRKNNENRSGGYAIRGDRETPIRFLGRLGPEPKEVLEELREVPVKETPERTITLAQVARVVEAPQLKRGDAFVNGQPAVMLTINKQPHVDTRWLTEEVLQSLREAESSLPVDLAINTDLFQMKGFIDRGVFNVIEALVLGAGLVILVLFLFLLNLRTTFISLTAIPLSLAVTALVFKGTSWLTGQALSINVMTLGGIAVAMGELVDDSIVDVENIYRRLRENARLPQPLPILQVVYSASVEVRSAIVFGTAMVILVFIPLFALGGMEGRLFTPLAIAYIVSILASLLISLTVTPVLSSYLLASRRQATADQPRAEETAATPTAHDDSFLLRGLKWLATPLVQFSMRRATWILLVGWLLVGGSALLVTQLGTGFLPPFDEGSVQVNVSLPPGSSLDASNAVCALIDTKLDRMRQTPSNPDGEILQFARRTGRAELDEHVEPVSNTHYILTMSPEADRSRDAILDKVLAELKEEVPGIDLEAEQPLAHLISHMISGVTAQIAIKIYGDDLDQLRSLAEQLKGAIQDLKVIKPPVVEGQMRSDEIHIRPRLEQLTLYGIDRAYLADWVETALKGEAISEVLEGQRRFDLVVWLDEPFRGDLEYLKRMRVQLPNSNKHVPLGALAELDRGLGANQVKRDNARRRIVVRVNVRGGDLAGAVKRIQERVDERIRPNLPEGYSIEYGGQFESQQRATWRITVLALVSVVAMFVVLYMLFPSVRIVLQILNALPMAFVGGVLALALTGQTLTVAGMVGFISLGGIAARNGILLVSHYVHLMQYEGEGFTEQMVLRGSLERLAPVLMTALTAMLALIPLVVGGLQPGREILYPVATVILGGLITSTLCEFLLHPGLFWRFSGSDATQLGARDTSQSGHDTLQ